MSIEDSIFSVADEEMYPHAHTRPIPYVQSDLVEMVDRYKGQLPPEIADEATDYLQSLEDTRS